METQHITQQITNLPQLLQKHGLCVFQINLFLRAHKGLGKGNFRLNNIRNELKLWGAKTKTEKKKKIMMNFNSKFWFKCTSLLISVESSHSFHLSTLASLNVDSRAALRWNEQIVSSSAKWNQTHNSETLGAFNSRQRFSSLKSYNKRATRRVYARVEYND